MKEKKMNVKEKRMTKVLLTNVKLKNKLFNKFIINLFKIK